MKKIICLMVLVPILLSCSSTRLVSSWKDPETTIKPGTYNKFLVAAILKDEVSRRKVEDQLVSLIKGVGVASYMYSNSNVKEVKQAEISQLMQKDSFDCAVVLKLVDVDKDIQYTPGNYNSYPTYYRSFRGYYYTGYDGYYTPGYYSETTTYSVEINIYDVKKDKLIWAGLTKSTNPGGLEKMVREIANTAHRQMINDGFITK